MSEPDAHVGARRPVRRRWLDLAAAVGAVCLAVTATAAFAGVRPLIVAGSSMEPAVPLGSLAVAVETPVERVATGDVVSVVRDDGSRVTHRVIGIDPVGTGRPGAGATPLAALTLQGDANSGPDATRPVASSVDRVLWTVPSLGRVVHLMDSSTAAFVVGVLAAAALASTGRRRPRRSRAVMWIDDVPYQVVPR